MNKGKLVLVLAWTIMLLSCQSSGNIRKQESLGGKPIENHGNNLVLVPGGTFVMGSPESEPNRRDDEKPHPVTLSDFLISKYDVTFEEYDQCIKEKGGEYPNDKKWGRGRRPVINIQWINAITYCNWKSEREGLERAYEIDYKAEGINVEWKKNSNGYRLPTEAEWEYAAKGGPYIAEVSSKAFYAGSENPDKYAWYSKNSNDMTHPVGEKLPNPLGLYDMAGNVWQFVWDSYGEYPDDPQINPGENRDGKTQLDRGGSFYNSVNYLRSSIRDYSMQGGTGFNIGFRMARNP
jgi:sulfatase modifying factor 1